jgi:hypothetical protein
MAAASARRFETLDIEFPQKLEKKSAPFSSHDRPSHGVRIRLLSVGEEENGPAL